MALRIGIDEGYLVVSGDSRWLVARGGKLVDAEALGGVRRGDTAYIPMSEACEGGRARIVEVPGTLPRVPVFDVDCSTGEASKSLVDVDELAAEASSAIYDDKSARPALSSYKRLGYAMAEWVREASARLSLSLRASGRARRLLALVEKPSSALLVAAAARNRARALSEALLDVHSVYVAVLTVDAAAGGTRVSGGLLVDGPLAHIERADGDRLTVWLNPPRITDAAGSRTVALLNGIIRDVNSAIARRTVLFVALVGGGDASRVRALLGRRARVVAVYPEEGEGIEYVAPRHRGEDEYKTLVAEVVEA